MENQTHASSTHHDVGLQSGKFSRLEEQLERLKKAGVNTLDPSFWYSNALLAAADLMGSHGPRAASVNRNASMLVASLLTLKNDEAKPAVLEIRHSDGTKARIFLGLSRLDNEDDTPDEAAWFKDASTPTEKKKRIWVSRDSVVEEDMERLVHTMAAAADSIPGAMVSLVGAGAVLACIQSMETMNAAKATFGFEGLGDDEYEFDFVSLKVVLEPALTATPANTSARPGM